ncbi:MarR family transcriptional regulator [Sphingopyxis lindanitolerans]|uniref:MarR family transcriptional regulator n=2 Tax=Sphingopyxis lindanitolerans TaxID=2054227 RepID=A0A2S8B443_9SPHN|nr:MarR family transcriptional regulator [Sphingopyxis lindanitolerans]
MTKQASATRAVDETENVPNSSAGTQRSAGVAQLAPERSIAFQIRRAHLAFSRLLETRLARHGVKNGYWYYLRALGLRENVTPKYLSEATKATETTTVALLKGMTKEGLVARSKDTVDRRQVFISLTNKGRSLASTVTPYATELNDVATAGISKRDIEICLSVLSRMANNLEESLKNGGAEDGS